MDKVWGLVLATSSSIFIAAPMLLNIGERYLRRGKTDRAVLEPRSDGLKSA